MCFHAKFSNFSEGLFRFETRVYLNATSMPSGCDTCVATVIAKNPGSATGVVSPSFVPIVLGKDKMLTIVRNIFLKAYLGAGKTVPPNTYVSILNLFYLCDPHLSSAVSSASRLSCLLPICPSESSVPDIVWYAWGNGKSTNRWMNGLKSRFSLGPYSASKHPFFYDPESKSVVSKVASLSDFAKHPQGLVHAPIVAHLARIL